MKTKLETWQPSADLTFDDIKDKEHKRIAINPYNIELTKAGFTNADIKLRERLINNLFKSWGVK